MSCGTRACSIGSRAWSWVPTSEVEIAEGGPDTLREIVLEVLGERDIPVLGNVDIGHDPPNVPLPLGVRAEVDADGLTLSLLEAAVSAS